MRKLLGIVIVAIFAAVLIVFMARNMVVKTALERGVQAVTGLRLTVEKVEVGVADTSIGIGHLKLYNPVQFEDRVMIDMPEIYVDYDLPAVIGGKIHLNHLRLHLRELAVVRNAAGELNLNSLNVVREEKGEEPVDPKAKARVPDMRVDVLTLKVGKVTYKDYSAPGAPVIREFNINIDESFYGINDPDQIVSLIVVRALSQTAIARLTGFDVSMLEGTISDTLGTARRLLDGTVEIVPDITRTTGQVQDLVGDAAEATKRTIQKISETFQFPFLSEEE